MTEDADRRYGEGMLEAKLLELRAMRASRTWRLLNLGRSIRAEGSLEAVTREWMRVRRGFAWRFLNVLRTLKYRAMDPFLLRAKASAPAAEPAVGTRLPRGASNRHDVICLSIIDWDFRFQRPQQLMSRFADAGHRVLYVRRGPGPVVEKRAGVYELSAGDLEVAPDAVVIVQHPSWWPLAKTLGRPVLYDCMDHHAGFTTEVAGEDERSLMEGAGLVVVSSSALAGEARKHARNVLMLRNACEYEHFAGAAGAGAARPVIGYYGAISDWFDVGLVAALARRRPDWEFLLVGSTYGADVQPLTGLPNVTLPGERPYAELPRWLGMMDVTFIPFRRVPLTEATNPVKVYEMLAAGKAVVSVAIPEVAALAPLVRLAAGEEAFERELESALGEKSDDAARAARRAFAREQTWDKRYAVLAAAIDKLRAE